MLQVEELSRLEVDVEEKMGRANQSLVQVKRVYCGMGYQFSPSFLDFPLPPCLGGFSASPHVTGLRRTRMSCASWRR